MNTPFIKRTLRNGVRLILVPNSGVNSIATSVMVGVGSRYETPAINGISHFLEHMVFKGTKKYPTTDDVNVIERQGGLQNAYTDVDVTSFHNKVLASDWELSLDINTELALHPRLEQKHIDKERDVILEEMKRYEDEPASKVGEVFHDMMYPGSELGMRIIGTEAALRMATNQTLRGYHDAWYRPDRIVVVVSGKMDTATEEAIEKKVESWYGNLEGSSGTAKAVTVDQKEPRVVVHTKPDAHQAHLVLGMYSFGRHSIDRFAWNVFNLQFGVGFTSRLFREIREKQGLCYTIRSGNDSYEETGYWDIYAGVANDKIEVAVSGIMDELKKVREKGFTDEEVVIAKKRLQTVLAFKSEDPEFLGEYYGRQELFGEPMLTLEEYMTKIQGVTKEEINKLISKYFNEKHLNLAVVTNRKDKGFAKLLHL